MWIAENMAKNKVSDSVCIKAAISSANNSEITAVGRDGISHLTMAAPSGICFSPKIDENAIVIKTESGDVCIGTVMKRLGTQEYPAPGELFLSNEDETAYIKLKADGQIIISGNVTVNGKSI